LRDLLEANSFLIQIQRVWPFKTGQIQIRPPVPVDVAYSHPGPVDEMPILDVCLLIEVIYEANPGGRRVQSLKSETCPFWLRKPLPAMRVFHLPGKRRGRIRTTTKKKQTT
jgi:hypothetical protein